MLAPDTRGTCRDEGETMKKGLAKGLSYTGLQMQDMKRRLLSTEESRDTLRARVAELEAVLQRIASGTCACDTFHGCVDARAALGAKGE
jgi:hypothetical protein